MNSNLDSFTQKYTQMHLDLPLSTPIDSKIIKRFLLFYKTRRKGRLEDSMTNSSATTFWKNFITT